MFNVWQPDLCLERGNGRHEHCIVTVYLQVNCILIFINCAYLGVGKNTSVNPLSSNVPARYF